MSDREFTNINGIEVCDQTARDNIPTKTSQLENDSDYVTTTQLNQAIDNAQLGGGEVDLSGYVTKEAGNASQITFADGQTFQAKLDNDTLKGEKGDRGEQGIQGERGPQGEQGEQGPAGQDGLTTAISVNGTTYTHSNGTITLPNYPTVPTNVSEFTNDAHYASETFVTNKIADVASPTDEQVNAAINQAITDGKINIAKRIQGKELVKLPLETMLGALTFYITDIAHLEHISSRDGSLRYLPLQPTNSNWAIVSPIELPKKERKNKKLKTEKLSQRAIDVLNKLVENGSI